MQYKKSKTVDLVNELNEIKLSYDEKKDRVYNDIKDLENLKMRFYEISLELQERTNRETTTGDIK